MLNNQYTNSPSYFSGASYPRFQSNVATDYGPNPFTINISNAAMNNDTFRTALWTGDNLQLTLMSIPAGEEIGVEVHPDDDQFLHIESGRGVVQMGKQMDNLNFQQPVFVDSAIFVPAGIWHNIVNTGDIPLNYIRFMHRLIIPGVLFTKLKLSLKQIQIIIDYNLVSSPIGTGESLIYHNSKTLISPPSFIV